MVHTRDTPTLKTIIRKLGNIIVTATWPSYGFISNPESDYIHHIYNHSRDNFGTGYDSTSRIESVWNEFKAKMKKFI